MTKEQAETLVNDEFKYFYEEFGLVREECEDCIFLNFIGNYRESRITLDDLLLILDVMEISVNLEALKKVKEEYITNRLARRLARRRKREKMVVRYYISKNKTTIFKVVNNNVDYWISKNHHDKWNLVDGEHGPHPTNDLRHIGQIKAINLAKEFGMTIEEFLKD
jgi:hypothetical protein